MQNYGSQLMATIRAAEDIGATLRPFRDVPKLGLQEAVNLLAALDVDSNQPTPLVRRAKLFNERAGISGSPGPLFDVLQEIERRMLAALEKWPVTEPCPLLKTSDFSRPHLGVNPIAFRSYATSEGTGTLAIAMLNALPAGHWLYSHVAELPTETVDTGLGPQSVKYIHLGPVASPASELSKALPRSWYLTDAALALSRAAARMQAERRAAVRRGEQERQAEHERLQKLHRERRESAKKGTVFIN